MAVLVLVVMMLRMMKRRVMMTDVDDDADVEDGDGCSKLDEDTQLALAISSSLQGDLAEAGPSTATNSTAPNRRGRKNRQYVSHCSVELTW